MSGDHGGSAMRDFSDYIMEEELIDLPLEGDLFTWSNGSASSRLDRFLVLPEWEGDHLDVKQYCLPRIVSDHKPMILAGGGMHRGPASFRFENTWLQVEGFRDLVGKWWEGYEVFGNLSYCLARKLRLLKEDLKRWNMEVFGRVEIRLATFMEELQVLESKETLPGLSEVERDRRVEMKAENERLLCGRDWGSMKGCTKNLEQWRPQSRWLSMPSLNSEEVDILVMPFGEEEASEVVMKLRGDKALGPGWFLYSPFCNIVGHFGEPDGQRLITENQNAFVRGRQILDALLVANECVDGRLRSKEPRALCKLGYRKGDHVSWEFLLYLLERLGFGEKWCRWIKRAAFLQLKFSVLVNGSAQGLFSGSQGRLSGFKAGDGSQEVIVSHLLFADDTLILCKAESEEMTCLIDILLCFQAVYDLRINLVSLLALPSSPKLCGEQLWIDLRGDSLLGSGNTFLREASLLLLKALYPAYQLNFLSMLTIPKSIASRLEKFDEGFLMEKIRERLGIHLVAWKIWRFALGEDKLWCRVLKGKYGTISGPWRTKVITHPYGIVPLREMFLELFTLATNQNALVADCWFLSLARGFWALLFRRGAQDWELEAFVEFFRLLQEVQPISLEVDKWRWKRQGQGSFTVSSFYHSLTGLDDPTSP
ncbi:hypothetical protein Acr_24g0009920 [Actinidia rufa]|uniref:Reverse transcriptase domain-containing protein n=1 Tax=Actinidia rufa TaxID=165716 RepID=A0A7J0GVJ4_9ERIC|nr:hypothetical protein Acr_24g0009920 [Actinidia rufa]